MKTKVAACVATAALAFTGVADASQITQYWATHHASARKMCNAYFNLVDLGWDNNSIYTDLRDVQGSWFTRSMFNDTVRFCFKHF